MGIIRIGAHREFARYSVEIVQPEENGQSETSEGCWKTSIFFGDLKRDLFYALGAIELQGTIKWFIKCL